MQLLRDDCENPEKTYTVPASSATVYNRKLSCFLIQGSIPKDAKEFIDVLSSHTCNIFFGARLVSLFFARFVHEEPLVF